MNLLAQSFWDINIGNVVSLLAITISVLSLFYSLGRNNQLSFSRYEQNRAAVEKEAKERELLANRVVAIEQVGTPGIQHLATRVATLEVSHAAHTAALGEIGSMREQLRWIRGTVVNIAKQMHVPIQRAPDDEA